MAFLGIKDIEEIQKRFSLVDPFDAKRLKNGCYELSLGGEAYLTDSPTGKIEILDESKNREVHINPGQFALLLTAEKVHIPKNKIAFISIKAGEKLKGLVNVSGFHVDPGFHDKLLFSVYNAGPSIIILSCGEPYFPIWFAELKSELTDSEAYNEKNEHFGKLSHIPSKYIEVLKRGELASPKALFDKIEDAEASIDAKLVRLEEKKNWNTWLYGIIIGLLTTILLKVIWDGVDYNKGYIDGKNSHQVIEQIEHELLKPNLDSIVSYKLDSLMVKRNQNDSAKGHH